jgi:hypothetical protein
VQHSNKVRLRLAASLLPCSTRHLAAAFVSGDFNFLKRPGKKTKFSSNSKALLVKLAQGKFSEREIDL